MKQLIVSITILLILIGCKNKPTPYKPDLQDTTNTSDGIINFSLIQNGDTLGKMIIEEDKHNIVLNNALHVDSLKMGRSIGYSFIGDSSEINIVGEEPQVFCFIQSINSNIKYNDFIIIRPEWWGQNSKLNYADIQDSIFYCEAFFCLRGGPRDLNSFLSGNPVYWG